MVLTRRTSDVVTLPPLFSAGRVIKKRKRSTNPNEKKNIANAVALQTKGDDNGAVARGVVVEPMEAVSTKEVTMPWWLETKERLSLGYKPKSFVGREKEAEVIREAISSAIGEEGGGSIYVSGLPGTGKSLTVNRVLEAMGLKSVFTNCASTTTTSDIFGLVLRSMGCQAPPNSLRAREQELVRVIEEANEPCVLVLDELDFLVTQDLKLLYSIFELPKRCEKNCAIVVGIANAVDLPERVLPWLRACKTVPIMVPFQPYSSEAMERILMQRITNNAIDLPAVKLCAKKVAAVAGDARLALDACRTALTHARNMPTPPTTLIGEIVKIFESRCGSTSSLYRLLDRLPLQQQIVLCSVVRRVSRDPLKEVTMGTLFDEYSSISVRVGTTPLSFSQVVEVCDSSLVHHGLVEIKESRTKSFRKAPVTSSPRAKRLRLCVAESDIRECFHSRRILHDLVS